MKINYLILLFCLMAVSGTVAGQTNLFFGIKTGANFSELVSNDAPLQDGWDTKVAFSIGLISELVFDDKENSREFSRFTLINEINYMAMGNKTEDKINELSGKHKLNYLNYTVMPRFYWGFLGKLVSGFYVNAGPYSGWLFSTKHDGGFSSFPPDLTPARLYETYDYGLSVGGGWGFGGLLALDFRYNWGLANIAMADNADFELYNRSWAIHLNLALPIWSSDNFTP